MENKQKVTYFPPFVYGEASTHFSLSLDTLALCADFKQFSNMLTQIQPKTNLYCSVKLVHDIDDGKANIGVLACRWFP